MAAAYADAEPKADADAYYGGYYGLGYSGLGLGYAGVSRLGYGLGYRSYASPYYGGYYSGVHAIGKRSADAEPTADADAYYYGYAAPYSYGYATRAYTRAYGYPAYGYLW